MCNPIALAVAGGAQAMAGNYAATQVASADNKNKKTLHMRERGKVIGQHYQDLAGYYTKGVDAEVGADAETLAANRASNELQEQLNNAVAESFQSAETQYVESQKNQNLAKYAERGFTRGIVAAKGASGRAISRTQAEVRAKRGRFRTKAEEIDFRKQNAIDRNFRLIGLAPQRGMMPATPVWNRGPSKLQQALGIASGAMSGYMMGKSLEAPKVGGGNNWKWDHSNPNYHEIG